MRKLLAGLFSLAVVLAAAMPAQASTVAFQDTFTRNFAESGGWLAASVPTGEHMNCYGAPQIGIYVDGPTTGKIVTQATNLNCASQDTFSLGGATGSQFTADFMLNTTPANGEISQGMDVFRGVSWTAGNGTFFYEEIAATPTGCTVQDQLYVDAGDGSGQFKMGAFSYPVNGVPGACPTNTTIHLKVQMFDVPTSDGNCKQPGAGYVVNQCTKVQLHAWVGTTEPPTFRGPEWWPSAGCAVGSNKEARCAADQTSSGGHNWTVPITGTLDGHADDSILGGPVVIHTFDNLEMDQL